MIDPVTGMMALTAASTAANVAMGWYTNKKKQDELAAYLKTMSKLRKKIEKGWTQFKDPRYTDYDQTPLTAEELRVVGKYNPQIATYVQEKHPEFVTESKSFDAMNAQQQALGTLREKARGGETAQARASRAAGMYEADASSRAALDRILAQGPQDAGTRASLAAQANQSQDQARYSAAMQAAAQDEATQMSALQGMGNLAGDIRSQNYRTEAANTDIINAFNQRAAQNQWIYNQQKANTMNEAQMNNLQNQQRVADANVGIRNQTNLANRQRQDDIARENTNIYNNWQQNDVNNRNDLLKTSAGITTGAASTQMKGMSDYWGNQGQGWSQLITGVPTAALNYGMYKNQSQNDAANRQLVQAKTNYYNRQPGISKNNDGWDAEAYALEKELLAK